MKALLLSLLFSTAAYGQMVVYDPVSHATDVTSQIQNLTQFVQMVNHQVTQITTMTQQLQQTTAYVMAFGDPSTVLHIVGADQLIQSVNQSGIGQTIGELRELASGIETLRYNANGLYTEVGETFRTFEGIEVPRAEQLYRKFAAVDLAATNFQAVYDDAAQRRRQLQIQIGNTTRQIQFATTDAEVQKLGAILVGQSAQLQAIDKEVEFAGAQVTVQEIENRNAQARLQQAMDEQDQAEFNEAMESYFEAFSVDITTPEFTDL